MAASFDITPGRAPKKRTPASTPRQSATGDAHPVVRPRRPRTSVGDARRSGTVVPLRTKRQKKKKQFVLMISILLLVLAALLLALLWLAPIRITNVNAHGAHESELPDFVTEHLSGTAYGVLPRNSIFFLPREELRSEILAAYPDIEAVSLSVQGFSTLSVSAIGRASSFWWCGEVRTDSPGRCFDTDATGKIFKAAATAMSASSTPSFESASSTPFVLFAPYTGGSETDPAGGVVSNAAYLPDLFRFIKTLKSLGANVTSAQIRGDEADLYTASGTRITYVLGKEQEAANLAATAFPDIDVGGSSLLYIDLRFTSKVYFRKKDAPAE